MIQHSQNLTQRLAPRRRLQWLQGPRWLLVAGGALLLGLAFANGPAGAHPGTLDEFGGHFDEETRIYHYHRPARDMALRKQESFEWARFPLTGTLKGIVTAVDAEDAIWVRLEYRPAYQELAQHISPTQRDDRNRLVRVMFTHVSPKQTGARDPKFAEWFGKRVAFELRQKLVRGEVTVQFEIVGGLSGRIRGMVFQGEAGKDNVNLWLVLNGWSYYVVADGQTPYDHLFRQAEDIARRNKAGIWEHIR